MRFPRTRLPVRHYVHVDTFEELGDAWWHESVVELLLAHIWRDDVRRIRELAAVNRNTRAFRVECDCLRDTFIDRLDAGRFPTPRSRAERLNPNDAKAGAGLVVIIMKGTTGVHT